MAQDAYAPGRSAGPSTAVCPCVCCRIEKAPPSPSCRSLDTFVWTSGSAQRARGLTGKQTCKILFQTCKRTLRPWRPMGKGGCMQTRETRARNVAIAAMSLSLLLCRSLMGQEGLSTLRGTIIDSSGAVIPGVTVAAREVSTNITARTASTDAQGNYEMPGLQAAN